MTKDEATGWTTSERRFGNVVGLEPEAEWLLGTSNAPGEALAFYLPRTLTTDFEAGIRSEQITAETVPFPIVVSPEPGGSNGKKMLEMLQSLAPQYDKTDRPEDKGPDPQIPLFLMTQEDQEILKNNGIAGALCNKAFFDAAVNDRSFQTLPKVFRLSSALREGAIPPPDGFSSQPPDWVHPAFQAAFEKSPKAGSALVVVGVIDDSFAIGHPRFQFSGGEESRIFSYWDQDADYRALDSTVAFGRELLSFNPHDLNNAWPDLVGLNKLLKTAKDEKRPTAEFYSDPLLRKFFPSRPNDALRLASHGTHVLDLAAGAPDRAIEGLPSEQLADEAPALLLVKLPRSSVRETSGAFLEYFLLEGVRHIVRRAKMMDDQAKIVIVSSYGFYGGPHDGASQIERALDKIIEDGQGDVEIVLPSGNGRLVRPHTRRTFSSCDQTQEIKWRVHPDDDTPSVMEIWSDPFEANAGAMVELSLVTPDGVDSKAQGAVLRDDQTTQQIQFVQDGVVVAQALCVHPVLHPGRRLFLIWMQPTALAGPDVVKAPAASGNWTIRLHALAPDCAPTESIWIRRDDSLVGFASGGRQSEIERTNAIWKDNPNFDQKTREEIGDEGTAQRSGTISKIGTGSRTVIVGGFDVGRGDEFPAPSSAGGPTEPNPDALLPARLGPDALAPSEIFGTIGLAAAGFFGGGKVRFRGTSVAAPLVASEIAQAIGKAGFPGGRDFVQDQAMLSEAVLPVRAKPSSALGGSGRYITDGMRRRGMAFEHSDK